MHMHRGWSGLLKFHQIMLIFSMAALIVSQLSWLQYLTHKDSCKIVDAEIVSFDRRAQISGSGNTRCTVIDVDGYGQYAIATSATDRVSKTFKVGITPENRAVRIHPYLPTPSDSFGTWIYLIWIVTIAAVLLRIFRPDYMSEVLAWLEQKGIKL